jgi:hypothetical protein
MSIERKIIGSALIGLAMVSEKKDNGLILGLTGLAFLFPKQTAQLINELIANSKQQTANDKQLTTNSQQQTANS